MNYVVVLIAKNEAQGISVTLDSLLQQSLLPLKILVIDDGSTDNMGSILKEYARNNCIISYYFIDSKDKTYSLGGNITRLFLKGKSLLDEMNLAYDFIVKMDADISFDHDFMSKINDRLKTDHFGIVSGTPYITNSDKRTLIVSPEWHTNGDFKIYNREFLEALDDFPHDFGWDCVDNLLAIEKSYKTTAFRDIFYKQNRPIGRYSLKKGRMRQGLGAYKLGYSGLYLTLKVLHDLVKPPYVIGSAYYLAGYIDGKRKQLPRTINVNQMKILRKLLWRSFNQRFIYRKFSVSNFPSKTQ
jgi:glycosyltransferase involved in cell wall biosynthesis